LLVGLIVGSFLDKNPAKIAGTTYNPPRKARWRM